MCCVNIHSTFNSVQTERQLLWKQQAYYFNQNCIPTKYIHLAENGLYSSGRNVSKMKQLQSPKKSHHKCFHACLSMENKSSFQGWLSGILCHITTQQAHAEDDKFMTEVWWYGATEEEQQEEDVSCWVVNFSLPLF